MTTITIDSQIKLPAHGLPDTVIRKLEDRLIFLHPKWEENTRYGRWQGDTPRTLSFLTGGKEI